jgi:hypothetical protein
LTPSKLAELMAIISSFLELVKQAALGTPKASKCQDLQKDSRQFSRNERLHSQANVGATKSRQGFNMRYECFKQERRS